MADEKNGAGIPGDNMDSESGLGNLPPLSDFDSTAEETSDSGLPPLGSFDSEPGSSSDSGGLPPISDIQEETPQPSGGAIKPPPPGFDTPGPESGAMDSSGGFGFQDLAADSDFSPETPDIGPGPSPGPSSGLDTPMFDSAFGGDDFGGGTSAPTQAMETPMFGSSETPEEVDSSGFSAAGGAFDAGAFGGGGSMGFDSGTPAPDFSPDTELQSAAPMATPPEPRGKKKGKGVSPLVMVVVLILGLIIGVCAAPYIPLNFLPNPTRDERDGLKQDVARLEKEIKKWEESGQDGPTELTPEKLAELREQIQQATQDLNQKTGELQTKNADLTSTTATLEELTEKVELKNEEFEVAQSAYEEVKDQTFLMEARLRGLDAEVSRLSGLVGELQDANLRRVASRDALLHNIDRLIIQIQEAMPLTPEKFDQQQRVQAAKALREKAEAMRWVTPEMIGAYTDIYIKELQVASAYEYFFANLPLVDRFGNRGMKWSECLMVGDNTVYYRSFDGENVGVYTNSGSTEDPVWGFQEEIEPASQEVLAAKIARARVDGFEEKVQIITGQAVGQKKESFLQRVFSSL